MPAISFTIVPAYAALLGILYLALAFAEIGGSEAVVLHLGGLALLTGRLLHGYALALTLGNMLARRYGMILTIASMVIGIGASLSISMGA